MGAKGLLTSGKYPRSVDAFRDLEACVEAYVLPGCLPPQPLITPDSLVVTQGSCFAENIAQALDSRGVKAKWLQVLERDNTPQLFAATLKIAIQERSETFETIRKCDLFIASLGVAKGGLQDCLTATGQAIDYIRHINPPLPIVLTVSPVPLNRSDMPSAVQADCLSKSTLRIIAHAVMQTGLPDLYYWPSFEIVRWLGPHLGPVFGADDRHPRHVNRSMVDLIVKLFLKHYAG